MLTKFNLLKCGDECLRVVKESTWFPYKTGWLRDHCTSGMLVNDRTYRIQFDGDVAKAHPQFKDMGVDYIQFLEEGTSPHDIPGAFGRALPFGVGGRFSGMFHPGSTKHKGFISNKSVNAIIKYICDKYYGEVR